MRAEVEAKLSAASRGALRRLAGARAIGPYRLRRRQIAQLLSVYLDTPGLALARRGIALRLRRERGRWELTAKWSGRVSGSLHERPELTMRMRRRPSFPFAVPRGRVAHALGGLGPRQPLQPVLITRIRRTKIDVTRAGAIPSHPFAEMALDEVVLLGPGPRRRGSTYREVEVELLRGEAAEVQRLAELLCLEFGLRPATESKFSRGMALWYGLRVPERQGLAQRAPREHKSCARTAGTSPPAPDSSARSRA